MPFQWKIKWKMYFEEIIFSPFWTYVCGSMDMDKKYKHSSWWWLVSNVSFVSCPINIILYPIPAIVDSYTNEMMNMDGV